MEKIRENVHTSFYARHIYAYQLRNIEYGTIILNYTNLASPWLNDTASAEEWLKEHERRHLDPDNLNRPNTKWEFVAFFVVDVKVVLDCQPLLGTGPLPDWLHNLAHRRAMVSLDTYQDNLCLWRCIAVRRGVNPHRSTQAARELAKSFFKLEAIPGDLWKTLLGQLDEVDRYLNKNKPFKDWIGIRVYEPEGGVVGEILWRL